jgi:cytochrome P450
LSQRDGLKLGDRMKLATQEGGSRFLTMRAARWWRPARRLLPRKIVVRHADCREVLDRHDVFRVVYLPRMKQVSGPFILGWDPDDQPRYDVEHGWLAGAVRPEDGPRLASEARALAEERVAAGRRAGGLDVVADLADPVIDDAIGWWFGMPLAALPASAPGQQAAVRAAQPPPERLDWARAAFYGVFLNALKVPAVRERARDGAGRLAVEIRAAAERAEPGDGDVLARLLAAQDAGRGLDRDAAVRNLVGLVTAWVPQVSRLLPTALDALLDRERELREAQEAARDGDVVRVGAYLWEAARFRSTNPLLPRRAAVEHRLPSGTTIPAGTVVMAILQAAMMDPDALPDPKRFVPGRPADAYMHFGGGLHRCFGEHAARAQLGEMATVLLAYEGLRRAGRVRWRGPFPVGLRVAL